MFAFRASAPFDTVFLGGFLTRFALAGALSLAVWAIAFVALS